MTEHLKLTTEILKRFFDKIDEEPRDFPNVKKAT
jgi:hypothetical protein